MIEHDLDADLERLALREGTSKAALIRRFVRERLHPTSTADDSIWGMNGVDDYDAADVDDVVYS
jgi:hypothetical protein